MKIKFKKSFQMEFAKLLLHCESTYVAVVRGATENGTFWKGITLMKTGRKCNFSKNKTKQKNNQMSGLITKTNSVNALVMSILEFQLFLWEQFLTNTKLLRNKNAITRYFRLNRVDGV